MIIVYKSQDTFKQGTEKDFQSLATLDRSKEWYMGIDGSSTSYGLAVYTKDYSDVNLFTFIREGFETIDQFRAIKYDWIRNYLYGLKFQAVTYERTPEGYKPPTSHAEKVMRETELAVKNFVSDRNYLYVENKDFVFDIFPNAWKSFSVPKDRNNLGKVDKEMNALAVLASCGLDPEDWIKEYKWLKHSHDYDCFEALGVGRYGSDFIITDEGGVRIYKNFSKIGTHLIAAKRIDSFNDELQFVGRFGAGRQPRICDINPNHSLPENLMGLYDKTFNNILVVSAQDPIAIYIDLAFNFNLDDERDYLLLGSKTSKNDLGVDICHNNGYSTMYI